MMPTIEHYKENIIKELQIAHASRIQGNEGRARVCARRAVGIALTYFFENRNESIIGLDAIDLLKKVTSNPDFPSDIQAAATRLSARISSDFQYSVQSDPIQDAKTIISFTFSTINS